MFNQILPYHSKTSKVYHLYGVCALGSVILRGNKVNGKGNKKLCKACKDNRAGNRSR